MGVLVWKSWGSDNEYCREDQPEMEMQYSEVQKLCTKLQTPCAVVLLDAPLFLSTSAHKNVGFWYDYVACSFKKKLLPFDAVCSIRINGIIISDTLTLGKCSSERMITSQLDLYAPRNGRIERGHWRTHLYCVLILLRNLYHVFGWTNEHNLIGIWGWPPPTHSETVFGAASKSKTRLQTSTCIIFNWWF